MISFSGTTINFSFGDTFNVTFNVVGYTMAETDSVTFSIKQNGPTLAQNQVVYSQPATHDASTVTVTIPDETMATIPVGNYVYDLKLQTQGGTVLTLNFPAALVIKEVAHNGGTEF